MTTDQEPSVDKDVEEFANEACQWLCELPDRSSPEDDPDICLVEPEELHAYLVEQLTEFMGITLSVPPATQDDK